MAEETKSAPVFALIIEFLIVVAVGLSILFFFLYGNAFQRGFYCDDESLRHPYKDSTVPSYYLYIFGFGSNLIAMIIGEFLHGNRDAKVRVCRWHMPKWIFECYKAFIIFCFGAACSQLITDSLKYTIGRLRPHFYTLCKPVFNNGQTCEKLTTNIHDYIMQFKCDNPDISARQLKEMRLSFPSGHSSFAMFSMLYCALYIGARYKCNNYKPIKHIIQYIMVLSAVLVGMSRVSDYKHHWSDVLGGLTIGVVSSLVTGIFLAKLFREDASFNKSELNQNGRSQPV